MKNIYFLVFISLFIITPLSANAIGFGGKITFKVSCLAGQSLLVITAPTPGLFLYIPGSSTLYKNYSLSVGKWVLGNYSPGGICWFSPCSFLCPPIPIPANGTIQQVGTS